MKEDKLLFLRMKRVLNRCDGKHPMHKNHLWSMVAYGMLNGNKGSAPEGYMFRLERCYKCGVRECFLTERSYGKRRHFEDIKTNNDDVFEIAVKWRELGIISNRMTNTDEEYKQYVAKLIAEELTEGGNDVQS